MGSDLCLTPSLIRHFEGVPTVGICGNFNGLLRRVWGTHFRRNQFCCNLFEVAPLFCVVLLDYTSQTSLGEVVNIYSKQKVFIQQPQLPVDFKDAGYWGQLWFLIFLWFTTNRNTPSAHAVSPWRSSMDRVFVLIFLFPHSTGSLVKRLCWTDIRNNMHLWIHYTWFAQGQAV